MAHHRSGHDSDRSSTRDQNVLAKHRKRKRSVNCIPKRIEYGRDLALDLGIMTPNIRHREHNVLRERARTIHSHAAGVSTKMPPACQAIAAKAAGYVPFAANQLPGMKIG